MPFTCLSEVKSANLICHLCLRFPCFPLEVTLPRLTSLWAPPRHCPMKTASYLVLDALFLGLPTPACVQRQRTVVKGLVLNSVMLNLTCMAFCSAGVFVRGDRLRDSEVLPCHSRPAGTGGGGAEAQPCPHSSSGGPAAWSLQTSQPRRDRSGSKSAREQSPFVTFVWNQACDKSGGGVGRGKRAPKAVCPGAGC